MLRDLETMIHSSHSLPPWQAEFQSFRCPVSGCNKQFNSLEDLEADKQKYKTEDAKRKFQVTYTAAYLINAMLQLQIMCSMAAL